MAPLRPRPFVMLFTGRSGSTALYGNLKAHPDVIMRAEAFGNRTLPGGAEQNDDNRIKFLRTFWSDYKADRIAAGSAPEVAKGFKFQVKRANPQFDQAARFVKVASEYDPLVVVLRRQNALKQAISALNAKRLQKLSGGDGSEPRAHITAENKILLEKIRNSKLSVDLNELKVLLNGLKKSSHLLDGLASKFPNTLDISYEQYLQDRDATVKLILDNIGVDPAKWVSEDAFLKITPDSLADTVENYGQLARFVEGTSYEHMLDAAAETGAVA